MDISGGMTASVFDPGTGISTMWSLYGEDSTGKRMEPQPWLHTARTERFLRTALFILWQVMT